MAKKKPQKKQTAPLNRMLRLDGKEADALNELQTYLKMKTGNGTIAYAITSYKSLSQEKAKLMEQRFALLQLVKDIQKRRNENTRWIDSFFKQITKQKKENEQAAKKIFNFNFKSLDKIKANEISVTGKDDFDNDIDYSQDDDDDDF